MPKRKQKTIAVIPRWDNETREIVLFFPEMPVNAWIECYTEREGHSEASQVYFLKTRPRIPYPESARLAGVLKRYESIGRPEDRRPLKVYKRDTPAFRAWRFSSRNWPLESEPA